MNEDLKPCYDMESLWVLDTDKSNMEVKCFVHKDYPNVLRIIDYPAMRWFFIDKERVSEERIIDINRPLKEHEKRPMWVICQQIINAEREIEMPYVPEKLTLYIELKEKMGPDDSWYLGILYYKDDSKDKNIVPIKRYFKTSDIVLFAQGIWQEISQEEFMEVIKCNE